MSDLSTLSDRAAAFSFGDSLGSLLPPPSGEISRRSRHHMMGLYGGVVSDVVIGSLSITSVRASTSLLPDTASKQRLSLGHVTSKPLSIVAARILAGE